MLNQRFFATLILAVAANPLLSQSQDATIAKSTPKLTSKAFSEMLFAKVGEIVLMSHNGRWVGTDNDLELRLRRDGTVLIIDYGFAIRETHGKYEVREDGTIVIAPKDTPPWLPLPYALEKGILVIHPPKKEVLFDAARRKGIKEAELTDEAYKEEFEQWPLRQIEPKKDGVARR